MLHISYSFFSFFFSFLHLHFVAFWIEWRSTGQEDLLGTACGETRCEGRSEGGLGVGRN